MCLTEGFSKDGAQCKFEGNIITPVGQIERICDEVETVR